MPCFGGGAIATADEDIAQRAAQILADAPIPQSAEVSKRGLSIWIKWLLTRPLIFGLTAYQVLRLKLLLGQSLMDSAVGEELLADFMDENPQVSRLANLQAAIGLLHLQHIDDFNEGARQNAKILTETIGNVPGIKAPRSSEGDHIYVYYPLTVSPNRRDDLRHYLLKHGIDSKTTDMADCSTLKPFRETAEVANGRYGPTEASILEICVYPVISAKKMRQIAQIIRAWAGLTEKE